MSIYITPPSDRLQGFEDSIDEVMSHKSMTEPK